ncbi:unnamed protein product, partial [Polarella glacialis]
GGSKLGFRFERPKNVQANSVRVTEILDGGCMMAYNIHQVAHNNWAYVVLPDMLIDAVNDVSGDSELITDEMKRSEVVILRIGRSETAISSNAQVFQKIKMVNALSPFKKRPDPTPASGPESGPET